MRVHNGDGVNEGMMFNGGGTTMATGHQDYGGIVYVYTDQKVMIWRPADNSNGTVVKIGQRCCSGLSSQESIVADVVIRVFHLKPKGMFVWKSGICKLDNIVFIYFRTWFRGAYR